jgi:NADP-dependent 3-hydroxy acid dehydrogenase YdfG
VRNGDRRIGVAREQTDDIGAAGDEILQIFCFVERIRPMTGKLEGKVAIITGASAGIGQASARALAREGACLVLTARRPDRLAALIEEVRSLGVDGVAVIGDAREEETALKAVGAAKAFGRVDILINNVGVGNYKKLVDTSLEDYVEMMDVNVPVMIAQGDASS